MHKHLPLGTSVTSGRPEQAWAVTVISSMAISLGVFCPGRPVIRIWTRKIWPKRCSDLLPQYKYLLVLQEIFPTYSGAISVSVMKLAATLVFEDLVPFFTSARTSVYMYIYVLRIHFPMKYGRIYNVGPNEMVQWNGQFPMNSRNQGNPAVALVKAPDAEKRIISNWLPTTEASRQTDVRTHACSLGFALWALSWWHYRKKWG